MSGRSSFSSAIRSRCSISDRILEKGQSGSTDLKLTPIQQKIVDILQNKGPQEPANLCERLQIKETDLERDIAALRHMEKIRGEHRRGKN